MKRLRTLALYVIAPIALLLGIAAVATYLRDVAKERDLRIARELETADGLTQAVDGDLLDGDAIDLTGLSCAQTIYAPVSATVYTGGAQRFSGLAATVSLRNLSETASLGLTRADYFDTKGELLRQHVSAPLRIAPLETVELFVDVIDNEGGSGANFLIEVAMAETDPDPLVEVVMIGGYGAKGISFASRGVVVSRSCDDGAAAASDG